MNLAQILTAVQGNTSRTDKDSVARTGVTLAFERITARYAFKSMVHLENLDIVAASDTVTLPVNRGRLMGAFWINGTQSWKILVKHRDWVLRRVPDNTSQNASYPYWAYVDGGTLKVTPPVAADGTIRLVYQQVPSMIEDSDENPIPLTDEAVISFATSWVYKSLAMRDEAMSWEQNGERALMDAITADTEQSIIDWSMDARGTDNTPYIEPYLDPFAGHRRSF